MRKARRSNLWGKPFVFFVVIGVVSIGSGTAHGKYGGGTGEPNDPYQIWDANHMQAIGADANDWDKCFILMADIDLGKFDGRDGREEFNMIGAYIGYDDPNNRPFTGVFDGNDRSIFNFTYESQDVNYIGVFGYVEDPNALQWVTDPEDPFGRPILVYEPGIKIKDVHLVDPNVGSSTSSIIGSLAGRVEDAIISGCSVKGGCVSGNEYVGGLAGTIAGEIVKCCSSATVRGEGIVVGGLVGMTYGAKILDSYASGSVYGGEFAGGLVGAHSGVIENCHSSGLVFGGSHSGGIAGRNSIFGSIKKCYSTCDISGDDQVGGITGENADGGISSSYSKGQVAGDEQVGGIAGKNAGGGISNSYSRGRVMGDLEVGGVVGTNGHRFGYGSIINCYSTSEVSGRYDVGGLVGGIGGTVTDSFWDVNTSGLSRSAGGEGKTTSEMQERFTFIYWDLVNVWDIGENQTYPYLRTFAAGDINKDRTVDFWDFTVLALQWLEGSGPEYVLPQISITYPEEGQRLTRSLVPPQTKILAQASDRDGTVVRVEFFVDDVKIGEDANGSNGWGCFWEDYWFGEHVLRAKAWDNDGLEGTSERVTVSVWLPDPPTP